MKKSLLLLASLILSSIFVNHTFAADVYAEYKMTGMGNKPIVSKMYIKNGDVRTEVNMDIAGAKMNTITLMLKSKPNVVLVFNSLNKTYTETKSTSAATAKNPDIKVMGNEKVGNYNCTRVKMTAEGKTCDIWYAKDLPATNLPVTGNDAIVNQKIMAQLKSKGITGMPVKIVLFKPNTTTIMMTMLLTKYEQKPLASSLFTIPAGYSKNSMTMDADKMKNMTAQERKEMIMKMMKAQTKQ
jgi:Domain of unknown function (DUF4412)